MHVVELIRNAIGKKPEVRDAGRATRDEVMWAWEQWQSAIRYFENVSDPELIDYAIYDIEAARRRYIYMLRRAESLDLHLDIVNETGA